MIMGRVQAGYYNPHSQIHTLVDIKLNPYPLPCEISESLDLDLSIQENCKMSNFFSSQYSST